MASGIVEPSSQGSDSESASQSGNAGAAAQVAQGQVGGPNAISRTKLVQRLLAASANLPQFVNDLITTQAIVVAGTEAAGFIIEKQQEVEQGKSDGVFSLRPIAHVRPDQSTPETRAAALNAFQEIVRPCVAQAKDGAVDIGGADDSGERQFCLVTLLRNEGNVVAVSAVITKCLDLERARQRLMSMQLVAGYFDLFSLRRNADQSKVIAQSHQHVLQLAQSVGTAEGFESGSMNLCNELATRTGASRVSIGWLKGKNVKVVALSHTEKFDKKQELIVQLQRAMEECLDQEEAVHYDPTGETSPNVTREAQSLSRSQGGNIVLSLPLRRKAEAVGVVTMEFPADRKLGEHTAAGLAVAVDLIAPQLYDRYQNDRWLIVKTGHSIQEMTKLAIGPKHTLAKVIIAASIAVILFVCLYRPVYHVSAPFQFAPVEQRVLCAPWDQAQVKNVFKRPGDSVKAGDVLVEFNTDDISKDLYQAQSRMAQAYFEMQKNNGSIERGKAADFQIAKATYEAESAGVQKLEYQMKQARVTAPFDGEVIRGDLVDQKGVRKKLGEELIVVAKPDRLRAEVKVDERDAQRIKSGQAGLLATSALPRDFYPIKVDHVVYASGPKDGENVFTVYAQLDYSKADKYSKEWRPGLGGEARIDIERKPFIWIYTHKLIDWTRLKLWSWGLI